MKTLAVVIGNDNYFGSAKLNNAVADAKAISDVFKRLSYDVIERYDCTINACSEVLEEFENKLPGYDSSIFYFAGHGFQIDGENFLTSVETQILNPTTHQCNRSSIRITELLGIFKKHQNKVNIVIIDACRKSFERGSSSLANVMAPKGTLIAFSTSPNESASDGGAEGHSVYTAALLKYLGRELLSVEELFKKVRKTVYNLTEGRQTTWEHTSLIGDFYFNTGQMVHSIAIPYDAKVVKDGDFVDNQNAFSSYIQEVKSLDWDRQNPAFKALFAISPKKLDKNEQFLLGRNILQAGGYAFGASNFLDHIASELKKYTFDGDNHVLNGILFEIYFNSKGEFRAGNIKRVYFDAILSLRKNAQYAKSFEFISKVLEPYKELVRYIPGSGDSYFDIEVVASAAKRNDFGGREYECQMIVGIKHGMVNITPQIRKMIQDECSKQQLTGVLAHYFNCPSDLIMIQSNIELKFIVFEPLPVSEMNQFNW